MREISVGKEPVQTGDRSTQRDIVASEEETRPGCISEVEQKVAASCRSGFRQGQKHKVLRERGLNEEQNGDQLTQERF